MHAQLKRSLCIAFMLLVMVGASIPSWAAGPFGFEYGMSKDQVADLIGKHAIRQYSRKTPNLYMATTAPNPHPAFGAYFLIITPEKGLIKISAISFDIKTDSSGEAVKGRFQDIQEAVEKAYGQGKNFDGAKDGSKLADSKDWMKSLNKKERTLSTFWELKKSKNHIEAISLEAKALNPKRGYLLLSYEFEGFGSYVNANQNKEDSVF